jgi:hypothetical protein
MNLKYKFAQARAQAQETAPGERKRPPEKLRWYHKSCALAVVTVFLFLALVPVRAEPVDPNLPLPQLLQKLHDLYLDEYPLFAEAFSRAVKHRSSSTPTVDLAARAVDYCFDGFAGWDSNHRIKVRVICSRPYHATQQNDLRAGTKEQRKFVQAVRTHDS